MSDNVKNILIIAIGVLTVANTVILMTDDDSVSYERTNLNTPNSTETIESSFQNDLNQANNAAAVQEDLGPKTSIEFAEMEHDFGNIEQNTRNPHVFSFTNTGEHPLIISKAKGSCGCTVPSYPREPIPPGGTGEIEVVYSPGTQKNQQTKTVTITANTEPETTILRIRANVKGGEANAEGQIEGAAQLGG
tara:strand:- start:87 stop:659 length:573 start_codon:yes stop_codon:yes gene_type:complete